MSEVRLDFVIGAKGATKEVQQLATGSAQLEQKAKAVGVAFSQAFRKADVEQSKYANGLKNNLNLVAEAGKFVIKSFNQQDLALKNNVKSVVSLQTQYRELKKVLGTLDQSSTEFKKLNAEAAGLKRQIEDINAAIDASDPEAKFNGVIQVTSGVAGGFGAVQGALGLLGRGGDDVYKQMLKLQQVMAFSQGLNDILGLKSAFVNLGRTIGITALFQKAGRAAAIEATTATGAQTLGITTNTAATRLAALATGGLINALKLLKAALLNNPFTAIAVALLAVVTALYAFAGSSKSAEAAYTSLIEKIDAGIASLKRLQEVTTALQEEANKREKALLDKQLEDMRAAGASEEQLLQKQNQIREREQRNRINTLIAAGTQTVALISAQEEKIGLARNAALKAIGEGADDEKIKEMRAEIAASYQELTRLKNQLLTQDAAVKTAQAEGALDTSKANAEEVERQKELHEQLIQEEKAFAQRMKDLRRKVQQEQINQLGGTERIEAQRLLNSQLIQDQQDAFVAEQQEILNQRAKRLKLKQAEKFVLSAEQKALFKALKDISDEAARKETEDLLFNQATVRAEAIEQENLKEIELARIAAGRRIIELRKQGFTETEAQKLVEKDMLKVFEKANDDIIAVRGDRRKALINAREQGKESDLVFEKRKALDILNIDRELLSQRLAIALIEASFLPESDSQKQKVADLKLAIKNIANDIKKTTTELSAAENEDNKFSIAKIFGFTGKEADEFNAAAQSFLDSAMNIAHEALAAEQALIDEKIRMNDEYISSLDTRLNELKSTLEEEKRLQEVGLANNVKVTREAIAKLEEEKRRALANDKKLNEEKKKLAKEQALIDSAAIASGLLISSINIYKDATAKGGVLGVVIGLAGALALIAGFLSIKSKINAANKLEKGDRIKGRRHSEGGEKFHGDRGTELELEEGEWVVNRQSSEKYDAVLEAINSKDRARAEEAMLDHLLRGTGIVRSKKINKELKKQQSISKAPVEKSTDISGIEKNLHTVVGDIRKIKEEMLSEQVTILQDGTKIIKHGNTTKIIHPNV